jgi:hypothetical protein
MIASTNNKVVAETATINPRISLPVFFTVILLGYGASDYRSPAQKRTYVISDVFSATFMRIDLEVPVWSGAESIAKEDRETGQVRRTRASPLWWLFSPAASPSGEVKPHA